MNAIQRWYIYSERGSERLHEAAKGPDMVLDGTEQLWCRQEDVDQLEDLLGVRASRIQFYKDKADSYAKDLATLHDARAADQIIENRLRSQIAGLHIKMDALLAHCPDFECMVCGGIICPHNDAMHFHHDGCPSCAEDPI